MKKLIISALLIFVFTVGTVSAVGFVAEGRGNSENAGGVAGQFEALEARVADLEALVEGLAAGNSCGEGMEYWWDVNEALEKNRAMFWVRQRWGFNYVEQYPTFSLEWDEKSVNEKHAWIDGKLQEYNDIERLLDETESMRQGLINQHHMWH